MDLASPDNIIQYYYPNWSIEGILGLTFNRLSAAEESTGFRSVSYLGNMSTYIFFIIVGAALIVLLVILFFGCRSRIKKIIEEQLEQLKEDYGPNEAISSLHLTFLESTITF
jgi:flagellar biosynthesis/type III secretory pathway M-ring protein FliF/YscJ